ncbi:hypothetical protein BV25DRAFT_1803212 [Artomyces pyxidatus]|uniref:Uncharacterized protein n=1 Tax=Artomyces pyxidatus TaxID=48021 RepID=A0ACB8T462_9AGAM|nr:hypothetical protein BV25DRAFT_1803212 [Artomyces pyxidatus]
MLKYSGDARYWSTYPPLHKEYRPLPNPPPPNSPYHKHGALIARLELVDALICFTYSLWTGDYAKNACLAGSWQTIEAFLNWTKSKWAAESSAGEREKAFLGLIWMIEAFIHSRKFVYATNQVLDGEMDRLMAKARSLVEAAAEVPSASGTPSSSTQPTPPMLPSPASIAPANSANSTPTGRPSTGTPAPSAAPTAPAGPPPRQPAPRQKGSTFDLHTPVPPLAASLTLPLSATLTHSLKTLTNGVSCAAYCMRQAQTHLTLHTLATHFPVTLARIVHSSLAHTEESEPDIEDEEGELFWPGAPETGEGLGWVCLMGKAMIKEFGKDIGYLGYDGVVPKPDPR